MFLCVLLAGLVQCADADAVPCQVELPDEIKVFIRESTGNYGKVKLVLHRNKFFVESPFPDVLRTILKVRPLMDNYHAERSLSPTLY